MALYNTLSTSVYAHEHFVAGNIGMETWTNKSKYTLQIFSRE